MKKVRDRLSSVIKFVRESLLSEPNIALSDSDADLLNSDRQVRLFGYAVIAVVFIGMGGWAGFAPLENAAIGTGTVQVEGDSRAIQHYEGGIVSDILVSSGDYVAAGQPLVQLDATQLSAQLRITEGRYWAQRATLDRLISERDGKPEIIFSASLLSVEDERAIVSVANEQSLFAARLADREGEREVLTQQIAQLENEITGIRSIEAANKEISESLKLEIDDLSELLKEGYVDRQRIRQLERSRAQVVGEISQLEARADSALVAINETQLKLLQLKQRFISQVVDQITAVQEELFDSEQRISAVSDRVLRTTVRAPVAGTVVNVKLNTRGAVVLPGDDLLTLVPEADSLVIDVQLSPMDIDRLSVGQPAEVRFAVFKDAYMISGQLIKLSADSLIDEISGQPYFEGKVRLDDQDIALLGDERLVPGMPAEVLIKTGTSTLIAYLLSPLERMFEKSLIED